MPVVPQPDLKGAYPSFCRPVSGVSDVNAVWSQCNIPLRTVDRTAWTLQILDDRTADDDKLLQTAASWRSS
jgi:hypothetical protein